MNGNACLPGVVVVAVALFMLAGCSFVGDTIKSELSTYAEPADRELAHIRLIGSRNVKVYPASTCVSYAVLGSGYPAGPQLGGQRRRDLSMPKLTDTPRHFVEIAARANAPITVGFSFYTESSTPGVAGTGVPGTRCSASCYIARSFVPQANQNYEVIATWNRRDCMAHIVQLAKDTDGVMRRVPVPSEPALSCPSSG